jgi:hypothetical protein
MIRTILAALAGYAFIGALIAGTDFLFSHLIPGFSAMKMPPIWYFLASMASDTLYTVAGGWLCAIISLRDLRATFGLIVLGEVMGIASTVYLWGVVPHFYSFYLLLVYPPAIWFGAKMRRPKASVHAL